jgi:hypothetical protein
LHAARPWGARAQGSRGGCTTQGDATARALTPLAAGLRALVPVCRASTATRPRSRRSCSLARARTSTACEHGQQPAAREPCVACVVKHTRAQQQPAAAPELCVLCGCVRRAAHGHRQLQQQPPRGGGRRWQGSPQAGAVVRMCVCVSVVRACAMALWRSAGSRVHVVGCRGEAQRVVTVEACWGRGTLCHVCIDPPDWACTRHGCGVRGSTHERDTPAGAPRHPRYAPPPHTVQSSDTAAANLDFHR